MDKLKKNKRIKHKRTKNKRTKNKRIINKRMKGGSRATGKDFEEELKYALQYSTQLLDHLAFLNEPANYAKLLDYLRRVEDKILILGGGPVGLFAAHYILTYYPDTHVVLAEKKPAYKRNQVINIGPNILREQRLLFDIPGETDGERWQRSAAHAASSYVIHDDILKEFMKYGCKMYRLPWDFRETSVVPEGPSDEEGGAEPAPAPEPALVQSVAVKEVFNNRVVQQYRYPDIQGSSEFADDAFDLGQVPLTADQTRCVDPMGENPENIQEKLDEYRRDTNELSISLPIDAIQYILTKLLNSGTNSRRFHYLEFDMIEEKLNKTVPEILRELSNLKFPIVLPALGGGVIDKARQYLTEERERGDPVGGASQGGGTLSVQSRGGQPVGVNQFNNGVLETDFVKLQREETNEIGNRAPRVSMKRVSMKFINKLDRGVNLWFNTGSRWKLNEHIEPGKSKSIFTYIGHVWRAVPGINVSNLDKRNGMERIKHLQPPNSSLDMVEWTIESTETETQIYTLTDNKKKDLKSEEKEELEALNKLSGVFEFTKTLEDIDWAGTTVGSDDYTKPQLIHGYITTVKLKNDSKKSYNSGNMLDEEEIREKLGNFNTVVSSLNPIPSFSPEYDPSDGNLEKLLDSFDNMEDLFGCHAMGPDGQGHAGFCYFIDRKSDNQSYARLFPKNSKLRDKKDLKEVPYHKVFNAPHTGELYLGIVANEKYLEIEDLKIRFIDALSRYGVSPAEISGFYGGSFDGHFEAARTAQQLRRLRLGELRAKARAAGLADEAVAAALDDDRDPKEALVALVALAGLAVVTGFSIKKHKPNLDRLPILVNDTGIQACLGEGYLAAVEEINNSHRRDGLMNILSTIRRGGSLSGFIGDAFYPAHFFTGSGVGLGCIGAGITIDYLKHCLNQGRELEGGTGEALRDQAHNLLHIQAQANEKLNGIIFEFSHGITDTVSNNLGTSDPRDSPLPLRPLLDTGGLDEYITITRAKIDAYPPYGAGRRGGGSEGMSEKERQHAVVLKNQTILLSSFKLIKKTAKELPVYSVSIDSTEGKILSGIKLIHGGQGQVMGEGRETKYNKEKIQIEEHVQSENSVVWYVIRSPSEEGDPVSVCRRYSDFVQLKKLIQNYDPGREFENKLPGNYGDEEDPEFRKKEFEMWLNEIIMVYFQGDYTDMIGVLDNPENLRLRAKMLIRKFVSTFLHELNWEYAVPEHNELNPPPNLQTVFRHQAAEAEEARRAKVEAGIAEAQQSLGTLTRVTQGPGVGATLEEGRLEREEERDARLDERELKNVGA